MSIKKKSLHSAVSSSFVRRPPYDSESDETKDDFASLAPYEELIKGKLRSKPVKVESTQDNKYDFQMLPRTELKVLAEIAGNLSAETGMSPPIYLCDLAEKLGHPVTTVKKSIQKLEKKELLIRKKFKAGRGGWTIYSVPTDTRAKLEPN